MRRPGLYLSALALTMLGWPLAGAAKPKFPPGTPPHQQTLVRRTYRVLVQEPG